MIVSWDRTDDRIYFGTWGNYQATVRLRLVAERLPDSEGWDWTVWQSDRPKIVRRGLAPSGPEATAAAEAAAADWWNPGSNVSPV
jgi:hypothetical protein